MAKAFDSALRLLTRREHGARELCEKLEQKGFSKTEAKEALASCQELDLQSDHRFVENYARSRIRQGYGPLRISQELKNKGVSIELIQHELQKEAESWLDYALMVWQKKSKGMVDLSFIEKQKLQKFLRYRGFDVDVITAVMREVIARSPY